MSQAPRTFLDDPSLDDLLDVPKPGNKNGELQIQDAIRLELGNPRVYPDVFLVRNNVGVLQDKEGRYVRYGLGPGSADLVGIFTCEDGRGLYVEAEIKTPTGKQSDEQKRREQLIKRKGGIYVVLRSVDDAKRWIQDLRAKHRGQR